MSAQSTFLNLIPTPLKNWVDPKSENRDDAFRERTIRITVGILITILLVAFVAQNAFFPSKLELISLPMLVLAMLIVSVAAALAVSAGRIALASFFTIMTMYLGAVGVLLINGFAARLTVPMFMLTLMIATLLVTPRFLLATVAIEAITFFVLGSTEVTDVPANSFSALIGATIDAAFLLFIGGLFLSRLRAEFDNRFKILSQYLAQVETSSQQLKHANEELKISIGRAEEATERAKVASQAKSQFLANMSHELRTPLNAINGYAEIMIANMVGPLAPKQSELIGFILENGKRQLTLVNNILDLSRIEAGADKIVTTPFSPRELTTKTIAKLESLAIKKNIYLKTEFSDQMPEVVISDNQKVQGILINLIGNALKFTYTGGVTVKIDSADQETWSIHVTDTGIGIPENELQNIFEMFQQVQNADNREHQGSGLGLTIVQKTVERLKGKVNVTSKIGTGSTFTITLPRVYNADK